MELKLELLHSRTQHRGLNSGPLRACETIHSNTCWMIAYLPVEQRAAYVWVAATIVWHAHIQCKTTTQHHWWIEIPTSSTLALHCSLTSVSASFSFHEHQLYLSSRPVRRRRRRCSYSTYQTNWFVTHAQILCCWNVVATIPKKCLNLHIVSL